MFQTIYKRTKVESDSTPAPNSGQRAAKKARAPIKPQKIFSTSEKDQDTSLPTSSKNPEASTSATLKVTRGRKCKRGATVSKSAPSSSQEVPTKSIARRTRQTAKAAKSVISETNQTTEISNNDLVLTNDPHPLLEILSLTPNLSDKQETEPVNVND